MNVLEECFAKTGGKGLDIDQFCSVKMLINNYFLK